MNSRWTMWLHKWLALIIGVQVFIWLFGGFAMSALPIEQVRSEHNIAEHPPMAVAPSAVLSLDQAAAQAGLLQVEEATLTELAGDPVWRMRSGEETILVSAVDGEKLSPISEELARRIAVHDFAPEAAVESLLLLNEPPTEYGPGEPVWQVAFADDGATRLYVDPDSGIVAARRSSTWRLFDFFWRLHVMDYDDGADFNHPLLVIASILGVIVAVTGLIALYFSLRRTFSRKTR